MKQTLKNNLRLIKRRGGTLLLKPVGGIVEIWKKLKRSRRTYSRRMFNQVLHFEFSPLLYLDPNPFKELTPVFATKELTDRPLNDSGLPTEDCKRFKPTCTDCCAGFSWPPVCLASSPGQGRAHGSPGSLLLIAEVLIEVANKVIDNQNAGVFEDITGALMATEALELLAGGAQTTAFEALLAQQVLEVRAECKFLGVGYNTPGRGRLDDIRRSVTHIAQGFPKKQRRLIELDTSLQVCNRISRIYRDYGQFDEDAEWSHYCRWLHDFHFVERCSKKIRWWMYPPTLFLPAIFLLAMLFLLQYKTFVMRSIGHFAVLIVGWIGLFTYLHQQSKTWTFPSFLQAPIDVLATFINVNLTDGASVGERFWTVVIGGFGIIHLGLFMALITSSVLRKT